MSGFPNRCRVHRKVLTLALTLTICAGGAAQMHADEQASFNAAVAQTAPDARIHSLQQFLRDYPKASRLSSAQQLLLEAYLQTSPEPTEGIHILATARITAASAGLDRWTEEARIADLLANAGEHGADLADAEAWAKDATESMTEPAYKQQVIRMGTRYKLPALTPGQLHRQFHSDRALCLLALANVYLRQQQVQRAAPLLDEALRLDPLSSEGHSLAGELALLQGQKEKALSALIEANALGPLPPARRKQEEELFGQVQHADAAALEDRIDTAYRAAYPPLFSLPKRPLPPGGHPVLLELFTGSDCAPCAGPDLALDSLLGTYSRSDLIALEFDEHIPRPDPLATPATVARAALYGVDSTPTAFLDGESVNLLGSSRKDVANLVVSLADQIEDRATLPSGLRLSLSSAGSGSAVIRSTVSLAQAPVSTPSTGDISLRTLQRAVLNVALVQDDLRYPGRNGVRFHRMVVRALGQSFAASALVPQGGGTTVTFPLATIAEQNTTYLATFEQRNGHFGSFHFPMTAFPLNGGHLALVAWVEDPVTRHVLQSAFLAVPPSE